MAGENEILELIANYQLSPSEAVDYYATKEAGHTHREWADARGLEGHSSVSRNVNGAMSKLNDPRRPIDVIMVDPDDIIEALRFNAKPRSEKNRLVAVLRISRPLRSESEATLFYAEEGNHYPPEMDPKPIHIDPTLFVGEVSIPTPNRTEERARAKDELDDPSEEEIEEWVETAFEVWEDEVRDNLKDSGDLVGGDLPETDPAMVKFQYVEEDS